MVKNYLIDTNILLQNPNSIFGFDDNNVWICGTTLQELDSKKTFPGEVGFHAREACRILDGIRQSGDLREGVPIKSGGKLFIEPDGVKQELLPEGFYISVPDNRIISSCLYLNSGKLKDSPVILLTNDVSMRVNASICGLKVQGVRNDMVETNNYTGHADRDVDGDLIDDVYANGKVTAGSLGADLLENEFVTLHNGKQSALTIFRNGKFENIKVPRLFGDIKPLNAMQSYAIWALMQPVEDIPLVIMTGPAGTSKTFLALATGLTQTSIGQVSGDYQKILISRPNVETSERGWGYLPGSLDEKMQPLLAAYFDNLTTIFRGKDGEDRETVQMQIDDLFESGAIEMTPLNFIRGRSLQNSFIILDEAQNAPRSLIRDVITRAGMGSKVVIAGDLRQVDSPTLDSHSSGLNFCLSKMAGNPLVCVIGYSEDHCVRSPLAEAAIRLMK